MTPPLSRNKSEKLSAEVPSDEPSVVSGTMLPSKVAVEDAKKSVTVNCCTVEEPVPTNPLLKNSVVDVAFPNADAVQANGAPLPPVSSSVPQVIVPLPSVSSTEEPEHDARDFNSRLPARMERPFANVEVADVPVRFKYVAASPPENVEVEFASVTSMIPEMVVVLTMSRRWSVEQCCLQR